MPDPTVSVVMVTCNVERFLAEAIESVLMQSFTDFEFIILDFGSSDNSKTIVLSYAAKDDRIRFCEIPPCFLPKARNAACSLARGRHIAIMDADDASVPERLAWQVEFMEKHPEVSVLGGAVDLIDANGRVFATWANPANDADIRSALRERCPLWQPTVMLRRESFFRVGGYRPFPAEDYDLWLRMSEKFQLANLQQVLLRYRVHPYQNSIRKRTRQTMGCLAARISSEARRNGHPDPLDSVGELTPELLTQWGMTEEVQQIAFAQAYLQWIQNLCLAGDRHGALNAAVEMLQSSSWEYAGKAVAEIRLLMAGIYWQRRELVKSAMAAGRAIQTRPVVIGRPLKPFLRWVGLARA